MMPAAALLIELNRQGIELQAHGDRLRYRPRSAVSPELADRLIECKAELLTILAGSNATTPRHTVKPPAIPTRSPVDTTSPPAELTRIGGSKADPDPSSGPEPTPGGPRTAPASETRIDAPSIPAGWTPEAWSGRLWHLATICIHPDRAGELRAWARRVDLWRIGQLPARWKREFQERATALERTGISRDRAEHEALGETERRIWEAESERFKNHG